MVTLKYQKPGGHSTFSDQKHHIRIEGAYFQTVMEMTDILQLFPEGRNMRSHKNIA